MKLTRGEQAVLKLEGQGWQYSHKAAHRGYKSAGSISEMQRRNGYDFCRVHLGRNVTKDCHLYQVTVVMRREEK